MLATPGAKALLLSGMFFVLFLADVLAGRILTWQGDASGTGIPQIGQFLAFFASMICFTVAILQKERAEKARHQPEEGRQ